MKRFLFATLLCAIGHCAFGADTDGDGLLDLIDVAGFNPNASGDVVFQDRRIQDLDGANLLANATSLYLGDNQITSLESGDFQGLSNLQSLDLQGNQITSLESGDFQGLSNLQTLDLAWQSNHEPRERSLPGAQQSADASPGYQSNHEPRERSLPGAQQSAGA